jgi:hypothetical protein
VIFLSRLPTGNIARIIDPGYEESKDNRNRFTAKCPDIREYFAEVKFNADFEKVTEIKREILSTIARLAQVHAQIDRRPVEDNMCGTACRERAHHQG